MKIKDVLAELGNTDLSRRSTGRTTQPGTAVVVKPTRKFGRFNKDGTVIGQGQAARPGKDVSIDRGDPALWDAPAPAKPKKSYIVNKNAKAGQTADAAGEFGSNKPRANIASTSTVSGSASNPEATDKFDKRQQALAKLTSRQPTDKAKSSVAPTGTVGGDLSDKTLNDRK